MAKKGNSTFYSFVLIDHSFVDFFSTTSAAMVKFSSDLWVLIHACNVFHHVTNG